MLWLLYATGGMAPVATCAMAPVCYLRYGPCMLPVVWLLYATCSVAPVATCGVAPVATGGLAAVCHWFIILVAPAVAEVWWVGQQEDVRPRSQT